MLYFDTSFLVPLILEEPTSGKIERLLRSRHNEEIAVSHWTRVEFSSLLAREVRMGGLNAKDATAADMELEAVIDESFVVLLPSANDFDVAKEFLQRYRSGLRAGDALHLAIASNNNARTIYSLDRTLLQAGRKLGLPVRAGIRLP